MSTVITLYVPKPQAIPRGAKLVAWLYDAAATAAAYFRARRATADLRRRTREAQAVREYAAAVQGVDPGFASDLYAAADRHIR